jgi:hypothetical protein
MAVPNVATRLSFQPTARDKITVLRIEEPTTIITPRFGPTKDLTASGSVARRDANEPEELADSSKEAMHWLIILLKYAYW